MPVVSYRNSTSNHNTIAGKGVSTTLYLIEILHQTTTTPDQVADLPGCILSKFYIKPQRKVIHGQRRQVVSYRNSTSNHNYAAERISPGQVVSYRNSTSNHNDVLMLNGAVLLYLIEILHQTTTSLLSYLIGFSLYLIEILHQTTTKTFATRLSNRCILSKFYIKPQQVQRYGHRVRRCILSKFYIKPQHSVEHS